jgi:hypothetical protein
MAKTIGQLTQATTLADGDKFPIEQSGVTKHVDASVVRGGLINGNIDAAAAIAFSKLAALDSANILVGNGSNVATKVAVTGDVTISNAGVTAIGSSKVVTAMITDANVTTAKIADANVTPAKLSQPLTLATAQATTSGTSIDFTGIPSWAKRVTVMFSAVSTNGTSSPIIQIGAGGVVADTGYNAQSVVSQNGTTSTGVIYTTGFGVLGAQATNAVTGLFQVQLITGSTWIFGGTHTIGTATATTGVSSGVKTLSDTLDRIRLTTVNGTDTFDAGSVNIMYEG